MDNEEKRILKTTTYFFGANFANFPQFFNSINSDGTFTSQISDFQWRKNICQNELDRLKKLSKNKIINNLYLEDYKKICINKYKIIAEYICNDFDNKDIPKLFLVNNLKIGGLENISNNWLAMSVDRADEEKINLSSGIYYNINMMTQGVFEFLVAHELIHWNISSKTKKYFEFVPWVEEGFCDILSAYYIYKLNLVSIDVIKNFFIYNKVLALDNVSQSYWNSSKNVLSILNYTSIKKIINFFKIYGRDNIENILEFIEEDNNAEDKEFLQIIMDSINTIGIHIDEYHLFNLSLELNKKFTIEQLEQASNMPKQLFRISFDNLCEKGLIFYNNIIYQPNKNIKNLVRFYI